MKSARLLDMWVFRKKVVWYMSVWLALLAFLFVINAEAQETTPMVPSDDEVNAIAKQMYCPVCENTPLDVCPTQACAEWRGLIREKLTIGWTEGQIKNYFVEQFGDRVLAMPPARGINWLVYVIPPLAFFSGAYILFRAFKAWKQPGESGPKNPVLPASDDYIDRLEEELRKL